jgi:DNA polymerase-4
MTQRCIIHIDMDAFYASVEQRDFPQYAGRPLVVGGDPDQRGVVSTCSYEARKFGIHSAMPSAVARRKCPQAIFVRPRFKIYQRVSALIQQILKNYTDKIEPLALDEAYLDVTDEIAKLGSGILIAKDIRQRIERETQLTASAGISYNKFLAKIASDRCKPNGLLYISKKEGPEFVRALKIREFFGVGPATEQKMHLLGIYTGADLAACEYEALQAVFGKSAKYYFDAAKGIDHRHVESERQRKSVSTEDTFAHDLRSRDEMLAVLEKQSHEVALQLEKIRASGKTATVKVKFADFSLVTRSQSTPAGFRHSRSIVEVIPELLDLALVKPLPVRLLGIGISNLEFEELNEQEPQIPLL